MSTQNGQFVCTENNLVHTPYGLLCTEIKKGESLSSNQIRFIENISYEFSESKSIQSLNSSQLEFIDFIQFHGIDEFIQSLKLIHDLALYHTDVCFDTKEKNALFNLKILWEGLKGLAKS